MRNRWRRIVAVGLLLTLVLLIKIQKQDLPSSEEKGPNDPEPQVQKTSERTEVKNLSVPESEVRKMIMNAEAESATRLQRIEEVCRKYNLGLYRQSAVPSQIKHPPTPQYSVFYIDKVHKLSWCPLYKAASTTWLYNLCLLGGYSESDLASTKKQLSELARVVYPELEYAEAEEAFQNTLKLLVVRHPFERLLSAYRDKLENMQAGQEHGTVHYYRKYGRRIVAKYRPGGNDTKTETLLRPDQYLWNPNQPRPAGVEPTFNEFVRYLLDTDLSNYADDHWIPYYLYCTPCLLKYDIIAKVETLQQDQVYVIHSANLQNLIKPRWLHRTMNNTLVTKRYFSQLSTEQVHRLYNKYKLDFELFNYKVDKYLEYATNK
ncbi:carbohydrate sulfotransferase 11 [Anabrus simplex]|uniref:carbohydrate sulfotransferase 11 n=1 Tax=Anabrus simplex TaxID=316456 RepID=UPI0034DD2B8C